jgi:hypothetical protein
VEIGRIAAGGLGESCQHGRFRKRQVPSALSEISLGGGLHAVSAVAEVDVVQVEGDDLFLGQVAVDLVGKERLLELPHVAPLRGEIEGFGDLLGDRAPSLDDLARFKIFEKSPGDALHVEALVLEEAGVLGGDEGLDHELRDLFVLDDLPVLEEELVDQLVVVGIDPRCDAGTVIFQRGDARKLLKQYVIDHAAPRQGGADEEHENRNDDDPEQGAPGRRSLLSWGSAPKGHG